MKEPRLDTTPPRGMRDLLPGEVELRDRAIATILDVYRRHGFQRIETPAVESIRLLTGGEGGENEKLIFKILKRGERLSAARDPEELADLGLRFDLTVPLARYYANNHARLPQPLKAIQIGPVWRAERPQAGRFRQFTQCDIDILGIRSEVAEIELILATVEALVALGLPVGDLTVRLNDRRVLTGLARHAGFDEARFDSVFIALDKLDKVGQRGVISELEAQGHPDKAVGTLMQLLDEADGAAWKLAELPALLEDRVDAAVWRGLGRILDAVEDAASRARVVFDPTLVRGMGYYTGPIFEIRYGTRASSIAGGGRYDRMIGKLLGRDVPATGFSIGFERVIEILTGGHTAAVAGAVGERVAIVFDEATPHLREVISWARQQRDAGHVVLLELRAKNLGRQLADLEARGFTQLWMLQDDGSITRRTGRTTPQREAGA
jgi:histidyl-tRNA synthetase